MRPSPSFRRGLGYCRTSALLLALVAAIVSFSAVALAQSEAGDEGAAGTPPATDVLGDTVRDVRDSLPNKPAPAPKPSEQEASERATSVIVEHVGADQCGIRFAFQLKERFASSPLFRLGAPDKPSLRVLVRTRAEFAERPWLGSVYSVEWLYSERSGVLAYHLDGDIGFVGGEGVDDAVASLASRTFDVAGRFAYLFE